MPSYEHFASQDFVADDAFINWVTNPSETTDAFWQQWLLQHPHKRKDVEAAARIVRELSVQTNVFEEEALQANWERIRHKTIAAQEIGKVVAFPRRWLAIAASVTILILAGIGVWQNSKSVQYATGYGEVKTVTLADGSEVTLNGNSRISFVNGFFNRKVSLTGEALFKVKKVRTLSQQVAFKVQADRVLVNVLGTTFNVSNRRENVEVMLVEGKVRLDLEGQESGEVMLDPGQKATISNTAHALVKSSADPEKHIAWLHNELIYNGEDLRTVFQNLEDGFGIKTRVTRPEILKKRFTGSVSTDSIQNFYSQLETIYHLQVEPEAGGYLVK
ncbi:FecR family protein [Dyadobacter chenhuakuii]|uniref:FecR domain-containing protein n=1 Tax=Dyadobacter chenhuakuii TaxID=2909339 RepID=A0A9X1QAA5_9BACT|nr:FecR domain-containing protein [Dyadobacter chenhuakuii]MCF2498148.1 FecR domain-containing protein [Dyadobacter chenhuakuii]